MKLLVASTNLGKLREFQSILRGYPFELVLPADLGIWIEIEETGSTYAENALIKAHAYAAASGMTTLADDSGLEVEALDGAPGLYSARYSPQPHASDADRRQLLVRNLLSQCARMPEGGWPARFVCCAALVTAGGDASVFEGLCPGSIICEERGSNGFGYDPVFYLPEYRLTMAELPSEVKDRISHRARAVLQLAEHLRDRSF